jgi:hypothetical protein
VEDIAVHLPDWAGTAPQWAILAAVLIALIKTWPLIQQQLIAAAEGRRSAYYKRIAELEAAVRKCQEECAADKDDMLQQIKGLHEELFGLRKQHIQEQISFARAILDSLGRESPQLNILLRALENGQKALDAQREVHQVTGVKGDAMKGNG